MAEAPDNLAPFFVLEVENQEIQANVTDFVQTLEYESSDGMADMAKVTFSNPDFILSTTKLFQPYNEMSIWIGWGAKLPTYIGRVILARPRILFPPGGMPTLEVKGYSKDWVMMRTDPADKKRREEAAEKAQGSGKKDLAKAIKKINYGDASVSDVVEQIGLENFMRVDDVDSVDLPEIENLDRPADLSDYDFIKCLSNLTGYLFWVDSDKQGHWQLHFKDPNKPLALEQEKVYTFKYNAGVATSLFSFEPEMLFQDKYTEIKIQAYGNRSSGKYGQLMEAQLFVDEDTGQDSILFEGTAKDKIKTDLKSAETVQLFIGEYSFKFMAGTHINTPEKLKAWAESWFRRNKENFIIARGRTVGIENLMARQEHYIEGLGRPWDGKYYMDRVRHVLGGNGYQCDWHGRKALS